MLASPAALRFIRIALTARRQHREGVGDLLIQRLVRRRAAVDLVEHRAVLDEQHARGVARGLDRVRHHEDGLSRSVDALEQAQQLVGALGVERAGRLVGEEQLRLRDERAGDRRALLLSAGKLIGELLQQRRETELRGERLEPAAHLRIRRAGEHQRQEDVVLHGEGVQQIEVLKHEAELLAPERGEIPLADGRKAVPLQNDLTGGRPVERG